MKSLLKSKLPSGCIELIYLGLLLLPVRALAFPEMIGAGYQSCRACHMDPSGSGPTTEYGKGIADEISTWSYAKEGEAFYGYLSLKPLGIHGDVRHLYYNDKNNGQYASRSFFMQKEASVSLDASKNFSALISCGYYAEKPEAECRRYFAQLRTSVLGFRAGRFLPAFGINIPDHTKAVRALFSQGKETLNAEVSVLSKYGEVFATRAFGRESGVYIGANPSVNVRDEGDGYVLKTNLFLARGLQAGVSYALLSNGLETVGTPSYHATFATESFAAFGEYQLYVDEEIKAYASLGVKPFRGLWLKVELDEAVKPPTIKNDIYGTIDWLPRPHFQVTFSASKDRSILVSHFYL